MAAPPRRRRHPFLSFVLRRVGVGLILLVLVSMIVFAATSILPGDVAGAALGRNATPEAKEALREELGLDQSLVSQYLDWVGGLLQGDLGDSMAAHQPVWDLIDQRVTNSLILALATVVVLLPLVLVLGAIAGARAGRASDVAISSASLSLVSVPEFVVGSVLVLLFGVAWGVLPPLSLVPPDTNPDPEVLVLPVATLVLAGLGYMIRMVRAGVADAMGSRYVEMARLNGTSETRIIFQYALRNALAPTVQAFALTLQWLIGGIVVIEVLFAYPGLGASLVEAVINRDLTLVQSVAMIVAATYIVINILADLAVVLLIPKLRTAA